MHRALGIVGDVLALGAPVAPNLTAVSRVLAVHQSGQPALAEAITQTDLDRGALFGAEFVAGHRATPYRNGRVLHSVFAAIFCFNAFPTRRLSQRYFAAPCSSRRHGVYKWQ